MKRERTYKRKGIGLLVGGISFLILAGGVGVPWLANNYSEITNKKVYREFKKVEQYYDKNRDGEMSIKERYFMYSKFGLESKSEHYIPNVDEMKKVIEEYYELDKAQFGIFDSIPSKTLEKEL